MLLLQERLSEDDLELVQDPALGLDLVLHLYKYVIVVLYLAVALDPYLYLDVVLACTWTRTLAKTWFLIYDVSEKDLCNVFCLQLL